MGSYKAGTLGSIWPSRLLAFKLPSSLVLHTGILAHFILEGKQVTEERWEKLEVWRQADEMAYQVYMKTRDFPKEEIYGITSQLRRAALSVPTNIVEGYSRKGDRELGRFLNVSLGSLAESKYLIYFSHRLSYLSDEDYAGLKSGYDKLGKSLWKFYETVSGEAS
jgi:four helix bundle protein